MTDISARILADKAPSVLFRMYENSPDQYADAARLVARNAKDADDEQLLRAVLGLPERP